MYTVKLIKIRSSHRGLRTDEVIGVAEHLPAVGGQFMMVGEPLLENSGPRYITTSTIMSVFMQTDKVVFSTLNSEYELEYSEIIK